MFLYFIGFQRSLILKKHLDFDCIIFNVKIMASLLFDTLRLLNIFSCILSPTTARKSRTGVGLLFTPAVKCAP